MGSHSDLKTGSAWVAAVARVTGEIFVTSRAAAAAESSPAVNCGTGREAGMWAGCQPAAASLQCQGKVLSSKAWEFC